MLRKIFIILFLLFFSFTGKALAFKPETFVTFANPVRGMEGWQGGKQGPLDLPIFLYNESTHSAFPQTWLLRYDAVNDATISAYFNNLLETKPNQTVGAFLEITPKLAEASNVVYPSGISIFNSHRIFLSGYSVEDRKAIIDTYMQSFFARFGFYPKSVSAWDLDSTSLEYLQSKYSVLTAMNCDDQYSTDSYRIWGGYLGSPYFPDKNNSLVPAGSLKTRVNLAMVRWAQRDLFNFYGQKSESAYSVQVNDYLAMGQTTKYFEKLMGMYEQKFLNDFTYVNIGLENDYSLVQYKSEIKNVYKVLNDSHEKFSLHPISLSDFGDWFKARYPESTPAYFYQSADPTGLRPGKVFWYQSPYYRIGIKSENGQTKIIDFRVYNREIYEEYFATPNQSQNLFREIPAVIDSVKFPGTEVILDIDMENATPIHSKQWDGWEISFRMDSKVLTLYPDKISFSGFSSPEVTSKDIAVSTRKDVTTWTLTPFTPFKDNTRYTWVFWLLAIIIVLKFFKKIKCSCTSSLRERSSLGSQVFRGKSHSTSVIPGLTRNPSLYIVIGIFVSLLAGLTVFRNGLLYPFGMGFWGPNGHDAIFHLSLIEKFSSSPFSFSHPQIAGEKISNYHFIFDFLSGITIRIFGITSLDFYFRIFPILAGVIIVFLLDKLLKSWHYSRPERLLSIVLAFLAGSFGFIPKILTGQDFFAGESSFWSNQSVSIFLNPPFALSIIGLLVFLILIAKNEAVSLTKDSSLRGTKQSPLSRIRNSILLVLLGALLAQTKIYAFILILGSLLFSRKYKLFLGILILGILISLPFTTLGGPSPFIFSPFWFPRSLFASFDRFYWPQLVSAWQAYEASGNFVKLALVNLFALVAFMLGNLGMRIIGLIQMFRSKSVSLPETLARWLIVFGLLIPLLFIQNINPWNTIQFMYYALFFLAPFTAKALVSFASSASLRGTMQSHTTHVIPDLSGPQGPEYVEGNLFKYTAIFTVIILATLTSIGTLKDYIGYYSASRIGYTELFALDKLRDQPKGIVLSPLFSTDKSRPIFAPKPLYSYVSTSYISALSGQPEFLSDTINLDITGFDYTARARDIQRFYSTKDKVWAIDFLEKNNISYVYETPLQKITLSSEDLKLKKIFDSGEINVYIFN